MVLEEGSGDVAAVGSEVEVDYEGTLVGEKGWSCQDVVECWLVNQQGLESLTPAFLENNVDGNKLTDGTFDEAFVSGLGPDLSRIQCKKLVLAAKRIAQQQIDFPVGTEFDSNKNKGDGAPYKFVLGKSKVIKAMQLAVESMKAGEHAKFICRADYAYGADGLRTKKGDVMVPPFASLCFDITLLKC